MKIIYSHIHVRCVSGEGAVLGPQWARLALRLAKAD